MTYELIVRTFNHVLYVSNISRLARPKFVLLACANKDKVWPSQPGYVTDI